MYADLLRKLQKKDRHVAVQNQVIGEVGRMFWAI